MPADSAVTPSKRMPRRMLQLRLPFLMVLVAGSALLVWAWQFRTENRDMQRSMTNLPIRQLNYGDVAHRRFAVLSFGDGLPDDWAALAVAARDADAKVRQAAIKSMGDVISRVAKMKEGAVAEEISFVTPLLIAALKDIDADVRTETARSLSRLQGSVISQKTKKPVRYGPDLKLVLPALIVTMKDPDAKVRAEIAATLGKMAAKTQDAPSVLLEALTNDPDTKVRAAAAWALCQPWRNAVTLWSPMLAQLKSPDQDVRTVIGWSLERLGQPPPWAMPALLEALELNIGPTRGTFPPILVRYGPAAKLLLPRLLPLARDQIKRAPQTTVAEAMIAIDPNASESQELLLPLVDMLRDSKSKIARQSGHVALAQFGSSAAAAVPALIEALKDPLPEIRTRAAHVLQQIGPAAKPAIPVLLPLAKQELSGEPGCFAYVTPVITIDPISDEAISLLLPLASMARGTRSLQTQYISWQAVAQLMANSPKAATKVKAALNDPDPEICATAAEVLKRSTSDKEDTKPPGKP